MTRKLNKVADLFRIGVLFYQIPVILLDMCIYTFIVNCTDTSYVKIKFFLNKE